MLLNCNLLVFFAWLTVCKGCVAVSKVVETWPSSHLIMDKKGLPSTTAANDNDGYVKDTKALIANEEHDDQNRKGGYHEADKDGVYMRIQLCADAGVIDDIQNKHWVKSVRIRSYSGPYFLAFRINTERYSVSLRIQSECGKMRTRITPNTDTFYAVKMRRINISATTHDVIPRCRGIINEGHTEKQSKSWPC